MHQDFQSLVFQGPPDIHTRQMLLCRPSGLRGGASPPAVSAWQVWVHCLALEMPLKWWVQTGSSIFLWRLHMCLHSWVVRQNKMTLCQIGSVGGLDKYSNIPGFDFFLRENYSMKIYIIRFFVSKSSIYKCNDYKSFMKR